jgi:DNA-binding Lrp family transcriptional regulator
MSEWTLISRHGLVLVYIAKYPRSTAREIASAIKITERTVRKIIDDLQVAGYIDRQRFRRNNVYIINTFSPLRHKSVRDVKVGDLLKILVGEIYGNR